MIYANTFRKKLPESWAGGLKFSTKQILRTGIVLYGFRLTLADVAAVGVPAVLIDLIIVAGTIFVGVFLGKILKIDAETALMTSTGSAICGAAAVLGAEPVVKCESHKTAIAVSTVVIFGTIAMFLYPILFRAGLFESLGNAGTAIFTGATLHEVAHVAGAGNAMDAAGTLGIAGTATITKMIRVMLLAPALVLMSFVLAKKARSKSEKIAVPAEKNSAVPAENSAKVVPEKTKIAIPWFAFGFIAIIGVNTIFQQIFGAESVREIPFNAEIEIFDTFLLTMAMSALGAETGFEKFKQAGAKPFILAACLFVWLFVAGYFLTKFIVPAAA